MSSPRSSSIRPSSAPNEDLVHLSPPRGGRRGDARGGGLRHPLGARRRDHVSGRLRDDASRVGRRRRGPRRRRPARPFRRRRDGRRASCSTRSGPTSPCSARRIISSSPSSASMVRDLDLGGRDRRRADPARRRRPRPLLAQRLSLRRGAARRRAPCRARSARRRRRSRAAATSPRRSTRRATGWRSAGFDPIDYVELRDAETLAPVAALDRPARLLAAARIGRTRLIDNLAGRRPPDEHRHRRVNHLLVNAARQPAPTRR